MLINASSATIAIVIGLSAKGLLNFEMAAAIVLGSNIGTTFDSFLVSLGANTSGKRAAWAHIMINVVGTGLVLAFFKPFILFVDFITPGAISPATAGAHIAMFHTMFNVVNTIVFLPLVTQYADILCRVIKAKPGEETQARLRYHPSTLLASPELNMAKARADLEEFALVSVGLFDRFRADLKRRDGWSPESLDLYARHAEYATSLQEGISKFLLEIARQDVTDKTRENIGAMLRMLPDLENIASSCNSMAVMQERAVRKELRFGEDELAQLDPFTDLVAEFLSFIRSRIDRPLSAEELAAAVDFENRVDACRADLKKLARKRIKGGSDVKSELHFIDLIRHIEKIGDYSYSVAVTLHELK